MLLALALFAAGLLAGGIASVVGFGIGTVLVPTLAPFCGTKVAVAAVAIPHLLATSLRFGLVGAHLDRRVFLTFGAASAAGGLAGALLHTRLSSPVLGLIFGGLLLFVGVSELTGLSRRLRFGPKASWVAGVLSGALGGLVGNQGGIRSAALLGFDVRKEAFIATSTAVALAVDLVRLPVYVIAEADQLRPLSGLIAAVTAGGLAGTVAGHLILRRLPETVFRRVTGVLVLTLGLYMLARELF